MRSLVTSRGGARCRNWAVSHTDVTARRAAASTSAAGSSTTTPPPSSPSKVPSRSENISDALGGDSGSAAGIRDGSFRPWRHLASFVRQGPGWLSLASMAVAGTVGGFSGIIPTADPIVMLPVAVIAAGVQRAVVRGWFSPAAPPVYRKGRWAVVTGASSGIGRAVAAQLAVDGFSVIATGRADSAKTTAELRSAVQDALNGKQGETVDDVMKRVTAATLELESRLSVDQLAQLVKTKSGASGLDILVNNAASWMPDELVITPNLQEYHVDANFLGPFLLTEKLLPLMQNASDAQSKAVAQSEKKGTESSSPASSATEPSATTSPTTTTTKVARSARIVYVTSVSHALIKGPNIVSTHLNVRHTLQNAEDVSPSVFNSSKQLNLSRLCNICHVRSLTDRFASKKASSVIAVAVNPGRALTRFKRMHSPPSSSSIGGVVSAAVSRYWSMLFMRTPEEAARGVLDACYREDIVPGGYYYDGAVRPSALSRAASDLKECKDVVAWAQAFTSAAQPLQGRKK